MARIPRRFVYVSMLMLFLNGCHSCGDSHVEVRDGGRDRTPTFRPQLFNGLTCDTAETFWACRSESGRNLDFATYFFTLSGIAVVRPASGVAGEPEMVVFTWRQPTPDRVEITTNDGEQLLATEVSGSVSSEFLTFQLDGGDFEAEDFRCDLRRDSLLDSDCNDVADVFEATPTPTPTETATPTDAPAPTNTPTPTGTPAPPTSG